MKITFDLTKHDAVVLLVSEEEVIIVAAKAKCKLTTGDSCWGYEVDRQGLGENTEEIEPGTLHYAKYKKQSNGNYRITLVERVEVEVKE